MKTAILVRLEDELLAKVKARAAEDDRSVASWIRQLLVREIGGRAYRPGSRSTAEKEKTPLTD